MIKIARYDVIEGGFFIESPDGKWVKHEDIKILLSTDFGSHNDALERAIEAMAAGANLIDVLRGKLAEQRKKLDLVLELDRKRGYPTGNEWLKLLAELKSEKK